MDTLYETVKRDLPKCRSRYMAESPNSSLTAFCNGGITRLFRESPKEIIKYGNQVLRGLLTQQRGCTNFYMGARIQYIVKFSIAKMLARKFDISIKKVFARYSKALMENEEEARQTLLTDCHDHAGH